MPGVTIAVVIKVNDGLVFASDSATTIGDIDSDGTFRVTNIYNNANKVFNLHKGLPIGAMTWGLGNIGPASMSSLAKDLRRRFTEQMPDFEDWKIDPNSYTIQQIAERAKQFIYDERYSQQVPSSADESSTLGIMVGGYSSGAELPEAYNVVMSASDGCSDPTLIHPAADPGASWWGQPEAISRLVNGVSGDLPVALKNLGVSEADAPSYTRAIITQVKQSFVPDGMPIQDAIDLADYLVDTTIKFVRFAPGDATVGGPIEIAAVTKHEGFKWIRRKHYFNKDLNPRRRSH